jgi:hypothetical protein
MANREKGEVALVIDGQTFTLVLNTNAMAEIEDQLSRLDGKDRNWDFFSARLMDPKKAGVRDGRLLRWGMTREHHPQITLADAGRMVDRAGGMGALANMLLPSAVESATPDQADVEALGLKAGNPPKAQAGRKTAGVGSTSTLAPVG